MSVQGYNIINLDIEKYSKDKKVIADTIGYNTLNKLMSLFKFDLKGDEETVKPEWLKLQLFCNGFSFITEHEDNLYAFYGGLGGVPDEYYQPTEIVVANPYLKLNKTYKLKDDGVLISFDTLRQGIIPIIGKYAGLLAENTITMRIADIMSRVTNILSASDESTITSALLYLEQIEKGSLGVIEQNPFLEDLKIQAGASGESKTRLTDLIEVEQYLKASLMNELGMQANYNMKRESINSNEAQLNDDMIQPYMDMVFENLKKGFDAVNEKYDREWEVDFASAWKENKETRDAELNQIIAEAEQTEAEAEQLEIETEQIEKEGEDYEHTEEQAETEDSVSDNGRDIEEPEDEEDERLADRDDE